MVGMAAGMVIFPIVFFENEFLLKEEECYCSLLMLPCHTTYIDHVTKPC